MANLLHRNDDFITVHNKRSKIRTSTSVHFEKIAYCSSGFIVTFLYAGSSIQNARNSASCIRLSFVNFALNTTPQTEVHVSRFKQLYLDNRSDLDTCSYEHFFSQWRILSPRKMLPFPAELLCIYSESPYIYSKSLYILRIILYIIEITLYILQIALYILEITLIYPESPYIYSKSLCIYSESPNIYSKSPCMYSEPDKEKSGTSARHARSIDFPSPTHKELHTAGRFLEKLTGPQLLTNYSNFMQPVSSLLRSQDQFVDFRRVGRITKSDY